MYGDVWTANKKYLKQPLMKIQTTPHFSKYYLGKKITGLGFIQTLNSVIFLKFITCTHISHG
jgi:hypothetical protein